LADAPPENVVDLARVDPGPLDERTQHVGAEVGGVNCREGAPASTDGGADGADDPRVSHSPA
jgi:hypothetical protein